MWAYIERIRLVDSHADNQRLLIADRDGEPSTEFQPQ